DYQKAIADANRAIQIDPRNTASCIDAYLARGLAQLSLEHYDQAVLDFRAALKLDPKDINALLNRGTAFIKLGKFKEGVADLAEAGKLDPQSIDASHRLAWLLATCPDATIRNGREATEYINRALKLDPNQWKVWDTRAAVFAENGDFENAASWEE